MAIATYTFTVPVDDATAAGDVYGYIPSLPEELTLQFAQLYVGDANCTGGGAACTALVEADPAGTPVPLTAALTVHVTNDNQRLEFVTLKTSAVNVAAAVEIGVKVTTAGATTAATTGVYAILGFGRPLVP